MNGLEIDSIVRSIPDTQKYWAGVFSSDTMPIRKIPYCFITNTAASHEVGDHWTAFFVDKNVEFFDSYGRAPTNVMFPSSFTDFIRSRDCFYSTVMVEGLLAKTCGQFCKFSESLVKRYECVIHMFIFGYFNSIHPKHRINGCASRERSAVMKPFLC